ncbi:hypothetical protein JOC58_004622 [Paenibacillus hunanensis]|uniref:Uncharacterized protein n=1 Tax=Paenibacillus hunanensis TaxID=539262 RepID=A0ABU1J5A0_9BACL|nr:hypothetical protein [Paenibacillus hunanensis]
MKRIAVVMQHEYGFRCLFIIIPFQEVYDVQI